MLSWLAVPSLGCFIKVRTSVSGLRKYLWNAWLPFNLTDELSRCLSLRVDPHHQHTSRVSSASRRPYCCCPYGLSFFVALFRVLSQKFEQALIRIGSRGAQSGAWSPSWFAGRPGDVSATTGVVASSQPWLCIGKVAAVATMLGSFRRTRSLRTHTMYVGTEWRRIVVACSCPSRTPRSGNTTSSLFLFGRARRAGGCIVILWPRRA